MTKRTIYNNTFLNYDEAVTWMESVLKAHRDEVLVEAKLYYNHGAWQVGCMFGNVQLELQLDFE
jgi:hypothetical protein